MNELWNWWFSWGAIIFLVTTIFIAALVLFDTMRRRAPASGWQIGVILAPVLVLPSVVMKASVTLPPNLPAPLNDPRLTNSDAIVNTGFALLVLGVTMCILAIILAIGYFMTAASSPARRSGFVVPGGGGQVPGWAAPPVNPGGGGYQAAGPRPPADATRINGVAAGGGGGMVAPRPSQPKAPASIYLRNGPAGPREHRLNAGRTTMGRALEADIMIDDPDVSRDHAHIQMTHGRFSVGDHGSTHGTYVNGQRIRGEVYLEDGDELRLGPTIQMVFKNFA